MEKMVWSGSGPIWLGDYDPENGTADMAYLVNLRRIGCGNRALTMTPSSEFTAIKESCSGQDLDLDELPAGKSMAVGLTMEQFSGLELAMAYFGEAIVQAAGTVTGERLPELAAGDHFFLRHPHATSVVIQDSTAGTPIVYVEGTHYVAESAEHGAYRLIAHPAAHVEPVEVDYAHAESVNIATMTVPTVEKGLVFLGQNHKKNKVRIIIPRVTWRMNGDFGWITGGGTAAQLGFTGGAKYVPELEIDPTFGPYCKIDGLPA